MTSVRSVTSSKIGYGWWAAFLLASIASTGCRAKIDVKTLSGGEQAGAEIPIPAPADKPGIIDTPDNDNTPPDPVAPTQVPGAISLLNEKFYFQTRDVITITINKSVLETGDSFRILNTTKSGNDDHKAALLFDGVHEPGNYEGFSLAESNDKLQFQFFTSDDAWGDSFFYGKNTLKLLVDDPQRPRIALTEVYLADFDIFDSAVTSFADGNQVSSLIGPQGYQFQGWLNVVTSPTVKSGEMVLTHGMFNVVNPH